MKVQTRVMSGLLLCSALIGSSGCVYDTYGRQGDRYGDRGYSDYSRYCETGQSRDGRRYDCRDYDAYRRGGYENRNR